MTDKRSTSASNRSAQYVFVLTHVIRNHSDGYSPDSKVVGVFSSKSAAVAHLSKLKTEWGECFGDLAKPLDEESTTVFDNFNTRVPELNVKHPPDEGVLIEVEAGGEGDSESILISKAPLYGGRLAVDEAEVTIAAKRQKKTEQPAVTSAASSVSLSGITSTLHSYYPKQIDGVVVAEQIGDSKIWQFVPKHMRKKYKEDGKKFPAEGGVAMRKSKSLADTTDIVAVWNSCLFAEDEGDGWLRWTGAAYGKMVSEARAKEKEKKL